jgi:hypothetical protein
MRIGGDADHVSTITESKAAMCDDSSHNGIDFSDIVLARNGGIFPTTKGNEMPNRENLLKWVEALESGKYEQTQGRLRRYAEGMCCLGVACDIAADEVNGCWVDGYSYSYWDNQPNPEFIIYDEEGGVVERTSSYLPDAIQEWLGFSKTAVLLALDDYPAVSANYLNDALGWNFNKIAAAIRHTYGLPHQEGAAS